MRKTKVTNVRIGDFIAATVVNGYPAGFYGTVESIIHISPNVIQVNVSGRSAEQTFVIDGPAGFTPDMVYRER
jgi:hypothetical protein